MAKYNIIEYRAGWDLNDKIGKIQLKTDNNKWSPIIRFQKPEVFSVVLDLLRNEKPILYDTNSKIIRTSNELVGEGEYYCQQRVVIKDK